MCLEMLRVLAFEEQFLGGNQKDTIDIKLVDALIYIIDNSQSPYSSLAETESNCWGLVSLSTTSWGTLVAFASQSALVLHY